MTVKKNMAASVHARLMSRARETRRPFQELLQYYAMERFLYRLSRTPYHTRLVLKGALMLHVWDAPLARATRDVDFLGRMENSRESVARLVREVCEVEVEPDGMVFDPGTVITEHIKEDAEYQGVRVRFRGLLGRAQAPMQLDIGFDDVVVPGPQPIVYPTLLDMPAPRLMGYPREVVVAEKFQAMVFLGTLNSRMKDFYDVWLLARQFDFDGALLTRAVNSTFTHRGTPMDRSPVALTPSFTESSSVRTQWSAFLRRAGLTEAPQQMVEVATVLSGFLLPVAKACAAGTPFQARWTAPGPWIPFSR